MWLFESSDFDLDKPSNQILESMARDTSCGMAWKLSQSFGLQRSIWNLSRVEKRHLTSYRQLMKNISKTI